MQALLTRRSLPRLLLLLVARRSRDEALQLVLRTVQAGPLLFAEPDGRRQRLQAVDLPLKLLGVRGVGVLHFDDFPVVVDGVEVDVGVILLDLYDGSAGVDGSAAIRSALTW